MTKQGMIEDIERLIRSGEWPPGMRLPTTEQLMSQYGLGESTVAQAMATLKNMKLIRTQRGSGRWVVGNPDDPTVSEGSGATPEE